MTKVRQCCYSLVLVVAVFAGTACGQRVGRATTQPALPTAAIPTDAVPTNLFPTKDVPAPPKRSTLAPDEGAGPVPTTSAPVAGGASPEGVLRSWPSECGKPPPTSAPEVSSLARVVLRAPRSAVTGGWIAVDTVLTAVGENTTVYPTTSVLILRDGLVVGAHAGPSTADRKPYLNVGREPRALRYGILLSGCNEGPYLDYSDQESTSRLPLPQGDYELVSISRIGGKWTDAGPQFPGFTAVSAATRIRLTSS